MIRATELSHFLRNGMESFVCISFISVSFMQRIQPLLTITFISPLSLLYVIVASCEQPVNSFPLSAIRSCWALLVIFLFIFKSQKVTQKLPQICVVYISAGCTG